MTRDEAEDLQRGVNRSDFLRGAAAVTVLGAVPGLAACGGSDEPKAAATAAPTGAKQGGRVRLGMSAGNPQAEQLDPHAYAYDTGNSRNRSLFDCLFVPSGTIPAAASLAESAEPNADGSVWTIRLRSGVKFHDGRPLTADDAIYSIKRMSDPKVKAPYASLQSNFDVKGLKRRDELTFELPLKSPLYDVTGLFIQTHIVPDGTTDFTKPVGTGPFEFVSWQTGQPTQLKRNDSYWQSGKPYLDELEIIGFADAVARQNALVSGQIDVCQATDPTFARAQANNSAVKIVVTKESLIVPLIMRLDTDPWTSNDVRQALKYAVDREQVVKTVFGDNGTVGNDMFGMGFPSYNEELPQREYDPEKARSLLQKAGQSQVKVELLTSRSEAGMLESATIIAEQAKESGFEITLKQVPTADFYGPQYYLKSPFTQTGWSNNPLETQAPDSFLADAPYNETAFKRPEWDARFAQAMQTLDEGKRKDLFNELQAEVADDGGYVVWGIGPKQDACASRVNGIEPVKNVDLGAYLTVNWWVE